MNLARTAVAAMLAAVVPTVSPSALTIITVFSDGFDAENGGVGAENYAGFANWTASMFPDAPVCPLPSAR